MKSVILKLSVILTSREVNKEIRLHLGSLPVGSITSKEINATLLKWAKSKQKLAQADEGGPLMGAHGGSLASQV